MPQSLAQIYIHIVFSTKERRPFLDTNDLRESMHAYLAGTCKNLGSPSLLIGGTEDHVHVLCRQSKTGRVSELVRELKRDSSKWIKTKDQGLENFHWQSGYGAFSVSPTHVEELTRYIADQEDHHRTVTFQEEFRQICERNGVNVDERYVWD